MNTHLKDYVANPEVNRKPSISFDPHEAMKSICPILIGIAGGSASGKTTLATRVIENLGLQNCLIVSFDSFYKTPPQGTHIPDYDFDHPNALDFPECYNVITSLLARKTTELPEYCFKQHRRLDTKTLLQPSDIIILEGILAFHDEKLTDLMNFKIFVSCDDDVRLYRRVRRDVNERGRQVPGIIYQYHRFVKPSYEKFIGPSAKKADILVPGNHDNTNAINFIVQNLRNMINVIVDSKRIMKRENIYHGDILDNCWLNISGQNNGENKEGLVVKDKGMELYQGEKFIFLRDTAPKNECIRLFSIFHEPFSKTLFQLIMLRLTLYAVKMAKRHDKSIKGNRYEIVFYTKVADEEGESDWDIKDLDSDDDEKPKPEEIKKVDELAPKENDTVQKDVLAIVVTFLDKNSVVEVEKKIREQTEKSPRTKIFVIACFSDILTMTSLTINYKDLYVVVTLMVLQMDDLFAFLKSNCKHKFDFANNRDMVVTLIDTCRREINRA